MEKYARRKSVFKKCMDEIQQGGDWYINMPNTLKVNGKYIIKDGEPIEKTALIQPDDIKGIDNCLVCIQTVLKKLFSEYVKCQPEYIPNGKKKRKTYFLPKGGIDNGVWKVSRRFYQARLEIYVMLAGKMGLLDELFEPKGGWYYQNPYYNNLIILKKWVE